MAEWAEEKIKLFIPCVGPGYEDTRIRPWNGKTSRDRLNSDYYHNMFVEAYKLQPAMIGITSYNEWHEGTQIEPAEAIEIEGFTYMDYSPIPPDAYLHKTRALFQNFKYTFSH